MSKVLGRDSGIGISVITKWLGGAVVAAGVIWLVDLGLSGGIRSTGNDEPSYIPVRVERGDLEERVVATGHTEALARVVVQSEIPGTVAEVLVDDGDRVALGQPLVRLDGTRLEDERDQRRAELDREEARTHLELVAVAEAEIAQADSERKRIAHLFEQGVTSEQRLTEVEYRLLKAKIALGRAKAEEAAQRAAAEVARKRLRRVERDLAKALIRSPIAGVVIKRSVEVGTAVADLQNGGTVVAVLADDQRIHLLGRVVEDEIAKVREGQTAEVYVDALPGTIFKGFVKKVASSGVKDGSVSRFEVEVELIEAYPDSSSDQKDLRVGMTADARILVDTHTNRLLIPNKALLRGPDGARVRLVSDDGRPFELRTVTTLYSDGFRTAVEAGLEEGSHVLVRRDDKR